MRNVPKHVVPGFEEGQAFHAGYITCSLCKGVSVPATDWVGAKCCK